VTRASPAFKLPSPTGASRMPGKSGPGTGLARSGPAGLAQAPRVGRKLVATVELGDSQPAKPTSLPPGGYGWIGSRFESGTANASLVQRQKVRAHMACLSREVCGARGTRGARDGPKHSPTCIKSVVQVVHAFDGSRISNPNRQLQQQTPDGISNRNQ
jgi:hypothetical protein